MPINIQYVSQVVGLIRQSRENVKSLLQFFSSHRCLMSSHVRTIDSDGDDEPVEETWFQEKVKKGHARNKRGDARKPNGPWIPAENRQPPQPAVYLGDATEQEVIDNVRNLPDMRRGGKVGGYLLTEGDVLTIEYCKIQSQNDFIREWVPRRALYLKTILAEEAPREPVGMCLCGLRMAKWWCQQCFGGRLLCSECCKNAHKFLPFHRIECWNTRYFQVGALWQIGLKIYLGHQGNPCPSIAPSPSEAERANRKSL